MSLFDLDPPEPVAVAAPVAPEPVVVAEPPVRRPVEVVRSKKRKRTVGAQIKDGVLRVTVPAWMSRADTDVWVDKMVAHFDRKQSADRIDLAERARILAGRYRLRRPTEIKWVDNMTTRWGSCTPSTGVIRLSSRLVAFPDWVIDSVIVHELAHLDVPGHDPAFWALANRYPKMERSIGFLIAKSGGHDDGDGAGFD